MCPLLKSWICLILINILKYKRFNFVCLALMFLEQLGTYVTQDLLFSFKIYNVVDIF